MQKFKLIAILFIRTIVGITITMNSILIIIITAPLYDNSGLMKYILPLMSLISLIYILMLLMTRKL